MTTSRQQKSQATQQSCWRAINQEVEAKVDPIGMATPLLHAQLAWLSHPHELSKALAEFSTQLWALQLHSWRRAMGLPSKEVVSPNPDDTRFAEPIWTDSASWDIVKESYLLITRQVQDKLYDTPGLSSRDRRLAAFWWREWLNAMAPTNFFLTNPMAMQKAIETGGESLIKGFNNLVTDIRAGDVQMARPTDFVVGKDLATTPGKVVFRNHLLEVLHYTPTQKKVFEKPIVIVTPWINKFYILDLNTKKSMVKFLVDQGFDVYITSWKNPTADMRDVSFEDYLTQGVGRIIETAQAVSGSSRVHAVGYCIGGAALTTWTAWANSRYEKNDMPVETVTLLATLVDYHKPGDIEVFLDESSIKWLEKSMARKGYLDGKEMSSAFRLLRSNSLVWHYVVRGYLFGEAPPPLDVLFWNMDATRMPAAMHSWYLRNFYLKNLMIKKDALRLAGENIDLGRIAQPLYAVSAEDDHIAPWRQTFRVNNLVAGPRRYVLSSSGHILGIVNPVVSPPKRKYHVGAVDGHETPDEWRDRAELHQGSWWEDWMNWLKPFSGKMIPASKISTGKHPALGDAPGSYVLEH